MWQGKQKKWVSQTRNVSRCGRIGLTNITCCRDSFASLGQWEPTGRVSRKLASVCVEEPVSDLPPLSLNRDDLGKEKRARFVRSQREVFSVRCLIKDFSHGAGTTNFDKGPFTRTVT